LDKRPDSQRDLGYYFALAQTGVEMVAPIAIGALLDGYFGWSPWGAGVGAVVGFVGGLTHMLIMLKRYEDPTPPGPPRGTK
jgi:F0F1-type ATP synthase assembly protein I